MVSLPDTFGDSSDIRARRDFLEHPVGLAYLVLTEAFERFSYYGMQGLLVLYMTEHLLLPGPSAHVLGFGAFRSALEGVFGQMSTTAMATQIFGLYGALVYVSPILGGLLGDRVLGRRLAVTMGAATMAVGHFLMASEAAFLLALLALILGSGLMKGNIAAQVSALYARDDSRRDRAFTLYYIGVNVAGFLAPLACGTLGEVYGWHYGFTAAGTAMLVGLCIYLGARRHIPPDPARTVRGEAPPLSPHDWRVIGALLIIVLAVGLFWTAQAQIWNTYSLWVRDRVDREAFGHVFPVTWFQSVDALSAFVVAPPLMWFWRRQAKRGVEPGDLGKVALGCLLFAGSVLWLSLGELIAGQGQAPMPWAFAYHFLSAVGYLYVAPTAIALFARTAPVQINAMMISVYYLSIFIGSITSGWLGRFYEQLPGAAFWAIHAGISAAGGLIVLALWRPLSRTLASR